MLCRYAKETKGQYKREKENKKSKENRRKVMELGRRLKNRKRENRIYESKKKHQDESKRKRQNFVK